MNFPRFFCPGPLPGGQVVRLPAGAARHAARVLRMGPGAEMLLFDGSGGEYLARIVEVRKETVAAEILSFRDIERESPLPIVLAQALQAADKMDLTIQKAVELGVAAIQPLASRRSVVRLDGERASRRVDHWRGVAAAACEQCGRNRIPTLGGITSLEAWLAGLAGMSGAADELRLMMVPEAERTLSALPTPRHVILLVGPEGGLDPGEQAAAQAAGFVGVRFGPRVLRTETAGLAAMAAMQALWGDFGGVFRGNE